MNVCSWVHDTKDQKIYTPATQMGVSILILRNAVPSLSDSLGGLETTKGQIESVSQTFVPLIINASLLSSLWALKSIFYHSSFYSLYPLMPHQCFFSIFSVSHFISLWLSDVFCGFVSYVSSISFISSDFLQQMDKFLLGPFLCPCLCLFCIVLQCQSVALMFSFSFPFFSPTPFLPHIPLCFLLQPPYL